MTSLHETVRKGPDARVISCMTMPAITDVLSQHAENASFLWELRANAISAPHYSLADLAKLDLRVEANLEGLRIAGEAGWEVCNEALSTGESGAIFAAAVLAIESGTQQRLDAVLAAGAASPERSRALVSAMGWFTLQQAEPHIKRLLASPSSVLRRVGIAASAIHRRDPGPPLVDAISAANPLLKARALRAVGELGLNDLFSAVKRCVADQDDLCRFSAAWSVALLSAESSALSMLTSAAESALPYREEALQIAIRRIDAPAACGWHNRLAQDAKLIRTAILAAGAYGNPARVPWLMGQMKVPELARVAGEAFTMITGVDIAYQDLDANKPADFEAGPTENPEDEDVEMDPDENLPWPDPKLVARWWGQRQDEFQPGTRYLLGKPISAAWCQEILRTGRQRQRAAAALELAIRHPGKPLFNVAAPGFRQLQTLGLRK